MRAGEGVGRAQRVKKKAAAHAHFQFHSKRLLLAVKLLAQLLLCIHEGDLALGIGVGLGARADLGALFARLELDELGDEADLAVDVLRGGGGRGGGSEGGARENGEPRQVSHGKVMVLQGTHRHRAS